MTQRELDLAKKAAAKFLPSKPEPVVVLQKINKKSTSAALKLELRFREANNAYEQRKKDGATMRSIEAEFRLNKKSLKNWRSYRMLRDSESVKRINKKQ